MKQLIESSSAGVYLLVGATGLLILCGLVGIVAVIRRSQSILGSVNNKTDNELGAFIRHSNGLDHFAVHRAIVVDADLVADGRCLDVRDGQSSRGHVLGACNSHRAERLWP